MNATLLSSLTLSCALALAGCASNGGSIPADLPDSGMAYDAGFVPDDDGGVDGGATGTDAGPELTDAGVAMDAAMGTVCALGDRRVCFDGDPMQAGVGICRLGIQDCVVDGEFARWSPCEGQTLPEASDTCGDGVDNNCDSMVDEGCASASYGPWGEFGACAGTCGVAGRQTRTRACFDGGVEVACSVCGGDCSEEQACTPSCGPTCTVTSDGFICDVPGEYEVIVPGSVSVVDIEAWAGGGAGGTNSSTPAYGGGAGYISAAWTGASGRVLRVEVAEGGRTPGGGGGASRVRDTAGARQLVAGAGGGGGSDGCGCRPGATGAPGGSFGGIGDDAVHPSGYGAGRGGLGGSAAGPGAGGVYETASRGSTCGSDGESGGSLSGGRGGGGSRCPTLTGTAAQGWHAGVGSGNGTAGGGGSGFFGGGGGGGRYTYIGGGGGGGSSQADSTVTETPGSGRNAGGTSRPDYVAGVGLGGGNGEGGGAGLVVIHWR